MGYPRTVGAHIRTTLPGLAPLKVKLVAGLQAMKHHAPLPDGVADLRS